MNEIVLNHPLITTEISTLLCYEATKDAKLEETEIETPLAKMITGKLNEDNYAVVPILRAGMGMVEARKPLSLLNTTIKCLMESAIE